MLVQPRDATLAIHVARQIVCKLEGPLLGLECLQADHVNDRCQVRGGVVTHDLIAKFRSAKGRGLVSVEIKLRQVGSRKPSRFNWQDTLENGALWDAELVMETQKWHSGILVFAELGRPCHFSGLQGLHISQLRKAGDWETLCGWVGFWPRARDAAAQRPPPQAAAKAAPKAVPKAAPKAAPRRQLLTLLYRPVGGKMVAPVKKRCLDVLSNLVERARSCSESGPA